MPRAAIYARFSSDNQSDKSVDDQIALCRDLCKREGLKVVAIFDDRAISGSNVVNRPGFQKMMRAAESRAFDVLVAEDMDRLFRNQGDYHQSRRLLDHYGVTIHTASGKISKLEGSLRALMGEMFIDNLILHTRRGMEGVLRDGRRAGGKAYGYDLVPGKPGELTINDEQAAIVKRIFAETLSGRSPRDIAGRLNADKIAPPTGVRWNASTINGNVERGNGILNNELYVGVIVWNKVRMVKDPNTGKRLVRPNPVSEHTRVDAPHLRIIDAATWQAVRAKRGRSTPIKKAHRVPRMLSGLLRCATCGGGMTSTGYHRGQFRVQCSTYRESGACTNSRMVDRTKIETAVLTSLRATLMDPDYWKLYLKTYNDERARLARGATRDRAKLERRQGEVKREVDRLVDAITKGVPADSIAPRLRDLEAERTEIAKQLKAADDSKTVIAIHPAAIKNYITDIELVRQGIEDGTIAEQPERIEPIRRIVHSVVVHSQPGVKGFEIETKGRLSELLGAPSLRQVVGGELMVAGEGLEPPTPGL